MRKKRIFWTDDINTDDYIESYKEIYGETPTDKQLYDFAYTCVQDEFDDIFDMLGNGDTYNILVLADLGRWNGRCLGYKLLEASQLHKILGACVTDYFELYSTGHNVCAKATHHDGVNYFEYRIVRDNVDLDKLTEVLNDSLFVDDKPLTRSQINYYTRSMLPEVERLLGY